MTSITLTRHDQARNMHRHYRLDVQPDLFGASCLVREWGRMIGERHAARVRSWKGQAPESN
jgi:predicted DNA-binding WGR domain protein